MANKNRLPKWSTFARRNALVDLFCQSGGFCVYGHNPCIGYYTQTQKTVCVWGKNCSKPMTDGELCRYKPEDGKPHLPCHFYTFTPTLWHCAYGDYPCYKPFGSHYEYYADTLIADWKHLDREQDQAEWIAEQKAIHSLGERSYPLRGQFSAISKDIFGGNQPLFYLEALGISGVTLTPFAKVRISSSYMRLYVDLRDTLREVSKNKRRKAVRYGKPLPHTIEAKIALQVQKAVAHYFNH